MTSRGMVEPFTLGALLLGLVAAGLALRGNVLPAIVAAINGVAVAVLAAGRKAG